MELSKIKSPISLKAYSRSNGSKFFDTYSTHFYRESDKYLIKYVGDTLYFIAQYWNPLVRHRGPVFSLLSMSDTGAVIIEQNSNNFSEIKKLYEKIDNTNDDV